MSGIDDRGGQTSQRQSFPRPESLTEEDEEDGDGNGARPSAKVVIEAPPAMPVPRSENPDGRVITKADVSKPDSASTGAATGESREADQDGHFNSSEQFKQNSPSPLSSYKSAKFKSSRRQSNVSFVTAKESLPGSSPRNQTPTEDRPIKGRHDGPDDDSVQQNGETPSDSRAATLNQPDYSSTTPLLKDSAPSREDHPPPSSAQPKTIIDRVKSKVMGSGEETSPSDAVTSEAVAQPMKRRVGTGLVRFNIPEDAGQKDRFVKTRLAQMSRRRTFKRLKRGKVANGEAIKLEKMLVRVEFTSHELPADFDENDSQKIESRTLEKWKEFMVVCREDAHEDYEFTLHMYKTRVIQAVEETRAKRRSAYEIPLNHKTAKVNLFSSLDKSIVVWEPVESGTRLYIMRPRSAANSMEWFTFLRDLLGWKRPAILHISVPDFNVKLVLDHPFDQLESSAQTADNDEDVLAKTLQEEEAAAGRIIQRCMDMLKQSSQWNDVVNGWAAPAPSIEEPSDPTRTSTNNQTQPTCASNKRASTVTISSQLPRSPAGHQPVGLAWKRYDRLEWVHGANEKKMYGTIGMEKSHELELRPKQHYPTTVIDTMGNPMVEPPPVEGFLIRLTSQRGMDQKLGRLFFKRLYFSTHNQYLVFSRPARSDPPPPPKLPMTVDSKVPNSRDIADKIPLIYSVSPYQLRDGQITWLQDSGPNAKQEMDMNDHDALDENERVNNLLMNCDGNIDLCNVVRVRKVHRGATPADDNVDEGSDVDFDQDLDEDTRQDDGTTQEFDDDRTFELVLRNRLVVRLQAFDKTTKTEWMTRLRALAKYWSLRSAADMALYRTVRQQNLSLLHIDEEMESVMGQFARKWELSQSYASPELYNMCGLSCCRTVTMSGLLFRKPRMHATFVRSQVVLTHGHLILFRDGLRSRSGRQLPHIHHERLTSLDLKDCYIYSGLVTDNDLLFTDRGPDSSRSGHVGLPRMYLEDGWSSTDEDTMTCFVIWHGKRSSWFRSERAEGEGRGGRLKKVSSLGVEGKSVVFKARSRAERDHWVMSISMEIERLVQGEDVRIVEK